MSAKAENPREHCRLCQADNLIADRSPPRNRQKWGLVVMLVATSLCGGSLPGCSHSLSGAAEELLEHSVPEHKPKNFSDAVSELRARHARIVADFASADGVALDVELNQLKDIIGWLNELAADSPMKKPQWDRVNQLSKQLIELFGKLEQAARSQPRPASPGVEDSMVQFISSLEELAPASIVRPE